MAECVRRGINTGQLGGACGDEITIESDDGRVHRIPLEAVEHARLVPEF